MKDAVEYETTVLEDILIEELVIKMYNVLGGRNVGLAEATARYLLIHIWKLYEFDIEQCLKILHKQVES